MTDDLLLLTGQPAVDDLVRLLDLQATDDDTFVGITVGPALPRVYGGQVAGQALIAAGRTVPADRHVHSLHSYFIRSGDTDLPIHYRVGRIHDCKSRTVRSVIAEQQGDAIFRLSASFQVQQEGIDHQSAMSEVPPPESVPRSADRFAAERSMPLMIKVMVRPFDLRYIEDPSWVQRANGPRGPGLQRVWIRTDGALPDDPLIHVSALTYASDLPMLDTVLAHHGLAAGLDPISLASLDHAIWFHGPFRADEWALYSTQSPSAAGGRGLVTGQFHTADGRHIASVIQEGMIRLPDVGPHA